MPSHAHDYDRASGFLPIQLPRRGDCDAREAVFGPDGGESHIAAQDLRFALLNEVERAVRVADRAASRIRELESERRSVEQRLAWTPADKVVDSSTGRVDWSSILLAALLAAASVLGMGISIFVLSLWVLRSASELFANDVLGATLLATMPALGAVSLKCFELRLESVKARWLYGTIVFAVGMISLLIWLVVVAVNFAPKTGGLIAALTEISNDPPTGIILLLTTGICDLSFGASFLSAIGLLLSGSCRSETTANPAHAVLVEEKQRLERSIWEWEGLHGRAKGYLNDFQTGRALTRLEATSTVVRARETYVLIHTAAQVVADAVFLSRKGDLS